MEQPTTRTEKVVKNFKIGMIMQIVGYILSFVNRTIFIYYIGSSYLGINQLFTNILSVLSLVEGGAEAAFSSLLYKPLQNGETETVNSIIKAFKKVFSIIAAIVAMLGLIYLIIDPNLSLVIKNDENAASINNLPVIYLLFLLGSVTNYLFTHHISLIKADQKIYLISICDEIIAITQYVLQIVLILIFKNFVLYVAIQVGLQITRDILLSQKAKKLYPYLKHKASSLDQSLKNNVTKRIRGGILLHTGTVITNGTDSILISAFLGVSIVGIYSNYLMITSIIGCLIAVVYNSINASVGDLIAEGNKEKIYGYFKKIYFITFVLITIFSCGMIALFNPFITIWAGDGYILPNWIVLLIVAVFVLGVYGIKKPITIFKTTSGLFYKDKFFYLIEGVANLSISILLAYLFTKYYNNDELGFAGIMIGTIASSFITFISGAKVLYKHLFLKPISKFFISALKYTLILCVCAIISIIINQFFVINTILKFILFGSLIVIIDSLIIYICLHKTEEYKYIENIIKRKFAKLIKK